MSPFVASVEMLWLKKRFPWPVLLCILLVLAGVAIVTVSDVTVHPSGVIVVGTLGVAVDPKSGRGIGVGERSRARSASPNQAGHGWRGSALARVIGHVSSGCASCWCWRGWPS